MKSFIFLYGIQGIIQGLIIETIPYFISDYKLEAFFLISAYPFALKVLWSQLVDRVGTYKKWVICTQTLMIIVLGYMCLYFEQWISETNTYILQITLAALILMTLSATCDIAIDAWSIHKCPSKASLYQTIGVDGGYYIGYSLFITFGQKETLRYLIYGITITYAAGIFVIKQMSSIKNMLSKSEMFNTKIWNRQTMILSLFYIIHRLPYGYLKIILLHKMDANLLRTVALLKYPFQLVVMYFIDSKMKGRTTWLITYSCLLITSGIIWITFETYQTICIGLFMLTSIFQSILFTETYRLHHRIVNIKNAGIHLSLLACLDNFGRLSVQTYSLWFLNWFTLEELVWSSFVWIPVMYISWRYLFKSLWKEGNSVQTVSKHL